MQGNIPPLISFHGQLDDVIPFYDEPPSPTFRTQDYDLSPFNGSAPANYNAESLCTKNADINCPANGSGMTFTQKAVAAVELTSLSSLNLYRVMKQLNIFSELYVDCSAKHGLDTNDNTCGTCLSNPSNKFLRSDCINLCTYTSNYGTNSNSQQSTIEYFAGRIAVFTHAIMYKKLHFPSNPLITFGALGESFFKDCENKRECNQLSNPAPCNNSTLCDGSPVFL